MDTDSVVLLVLFSFSTLWTSTCKYNKRYCALFDWFTVFMEDLCKSYPFFLILMCNYLNNLGHFIIFTVCWLRWLWILQQLSPIILFAIYWLSWLLFRSRFSTLALGWGAITFTKNRNKKDFTLVHSFTGFIEKYHTKVFIWQGKKKPFKLFPY